MTDNEKILILQSMADESDYQTLLAYLSLAAEIVLNRCYPFGGGEEVPARYCRKQIEIACYLLNKRGAEGQLTHTENGISRSYESASVPESMLKDIIPFCGLIK